jgi:predicted ester cyclase
MDGPDVSQPSVELVRYLFAEVLNRRDVEELALWWHDDIVEEFPSGAVRGRAAVRAHFEETFRAIPDFHVDVLEVAGNGDVFFVKWRMSGTFSGAAWMGVEPTGTRFVLEGIDCCTFSGARMLHTFVCYDQIAFARQIGMMPPAGSATETAMKAAFNARTRIRKSFRPPPM